jgi:hypothetical protein
MRHRDRSLRKAQNRRKMENGTLPDTLGVRSQIHRGKPIPTPISRPADFVPPTKSTPSFASRVISRVKSFLGMRGVR